MLNVILLNSQGYQITSMLSVILLNSQGYQITSMLFDNLGCLIR
jgi:hypothetical protein